MELNSGKSSIVTIKTDLYSILDKYLPQKTTTENNLAYISTLIPHRSRDEQSSGCTIVLTIKSPV